MTLVLVRIVRIVRIQGFGSPIRDRPPKTPPKTLELSVPAGRGCHLTPSEVGKDGGDEDHRERYPGDQPDVSTEILLEEDADPVVLKAASEQ